MKESKFLLLNDIHVSKDNIPEFYDNWGEAIEICKERGIEDIIVGGDMFQSRSSQTLDVLLAVQNALQTARTNHIFVTLAEGNHDLVDQEALRGYNSIFNDYPDVEVVDDYFVYSVSDNVDLFVMSYFPENGSFIERYNEMVSKDMREHNTNILYIHEGIKGGLATPSDDELPASIFEPFDSVLVGHYHDRKHIPGTNIQYIGASRQHNFGEDEEKGYTILYSDGSTEFVKNKVNTRYRVIDIESLEDINDDFYAMMQQLRSSGKYKFKLRVHCLSSEASSIDKQKLIDAGASKVELVTEQAKIKLTESQSIEKKFDKQGIKEEYSSFCAERNIQNVEMGLSYLDKIK